MEHHEMKVGVTGGAGFLGSHTVDQLIEQGVKTVVIDDFSAGKMENIQPQMKRDEFELRKVDLKEFDSARRALQDLNVIVHLAAKIGGIGFFHKIPADIIADNDLINRNVFNASLSCNIHRIIYFSSSMVFERATSFPTKEEDLTKIPPPKSAYGFQKLSGEYYCKAYQKQYGLEYTILRPFNAVGPREFPEEETGHAHVIPDLVRKIVDLRQYPLEILGSGDQVRAFTNVKDLAQGCYLAIFSEAATNEDFNLGNPNEITIKKLARKIWSIAGRKEPIKFKHLESFPEDVQRRIPCSDKARDLLGWEPRVPLEESLEEYISWYRQIR